MSKNKKKLAKNKKKLAKIKKFGHFLQKSNFFALFLAKIKVFFSPQNPIWFLQKSKNWAETHKPTKLTTMIKTIS